jgi:hypothetical protein
MYLNRKSITAGEFNKTTMRGNGRAGIMGVTLDNVFKIRSKKSSSLDYL